MNSDPKHLDRRMTKHCSGGYRRGQAPAAPAGPSDNRARGERLAARRRPYPPMIFREWSADVPQRLEGSLAVKPGGRDEPGDGCSRDVLDQRTAGADQLRRPSAREAEKFAFAGGHESGTQPIRGAGVLGGVAMKIAVDEHLDAGLGPAAQTRCKRGAGDNRRVSPVVRDDEHCQALADMGPKKLEEAVDLAFETRRDIVDRREQKALAVHWKSVLAPFRTGVVDPGLTKLHLNFTGW